MVRQILFDGGVGMGISEIADGNMRFFEGDEQNVILSQVKLGELVGLSGDKIVRLRTTYGDRKNFTEYKEITNKTLVKYSILNSGKTIPTLDGIVVRSPEIGILLPLADCIGIVVFDKKQKILGLLHAGRHNIEQNGPRKFIEYMVGEFGCNTSDMKIYFSPYAINYCIFNLGNKNMAEVAKEQFSKAGILDKNISDPRIDTVSNKNFPSHSAGDCNFRFGVVVRMLR